MRELTYMLALNGKLIRSPNGRGWWLWHPVGWWDFCDEYGPFFSAKQDKVKWTEWKKFRKRHQREHEKRARR